MMQITHAPTGAALGRFIPNPYLAFIAGIVLHFLVDKIPHWWPDGWQNKGVVIFFDYFLTILFIWYLYRADMLTPGVVGAMAGSLIVDIVMVGIPWVYHSKLGRWHEERQFHYTNPFVFVTDLVVILIACLLLFN